MKNTQTTKTATACQKTLQHYMQEQLDAYFAYEAKRAIQNADWSKAFRKCDCNAKFVDPRCTIHGAHEYHGKPNEPQHSPLPWRVDFNKYDQQYRVYSGQVPVINSMFHGDKAEDAELIVASVNHAGKLAEALRELFENCAMVHKHWGEGSNQAEADTAIAKAREALARWEAK